ncbi:hypothetical protein EJB05_12336, partial [Eragrostis curvula]
MDVVTGVVGNLLPKLLKLLGDEYKLQKGMKKKVKFITRELESIQAFLQKVGAVPWDELDKQLQVWSNEAREVSYDMEDLLDTFFVRFNVREPPNPSMLKRSMNKMANLFSKGKARRDVSCAIEEIKNQLQEVADRRDRYKIDDIVVNPAATTLTVDPRLKAMYKEVASLVGIEEPSKDLISKLSVQGDDIDLRKKIVAIVGIGGLGKTTLAKAVYDKLRAKFDCGAFVPVGRNPSLTKVLKDILYELDKNKYSDINSKNRDQKQLIDNLREFLLDKRYFVVIDDIWENEPWEERIELALLENNRGSRIIITTRKFEVATKVGDEVYKMQKLSDDNSGKLFYTRILGGDGRCLGNQSDEVVKKIIRKCDGVPLAIITMASLLAGKPRERWSDVFTSIGFGHTDDKQVENTMKILSYSYYDMPAHLRTCLLYLSAFPEDYEIKKESLIWKWIAEGFIQGKQGMWLFELGEQYFNDLVNRSMVHAIEDDSASTVESCRVHDMVLDLIRFISSKENFVNILDNGEGTLSPPPSSTRRLALHKNTMKHTAHGNMVGMPQVRSFIAISCSFGNWIPLSSFKLLRVLDMQHCKNVRSCHLVHLESLLHLRYLGLENTGVDDLPDEIGALNFLQILNLENTRIKQLNPSVSRLTQLVCLKGDLGSTLAPNWIEKLTSLEVLHIAIDVGEDGRKKHARKFFKALGSLRELREFRIIVDGIVDVRDERDFLLSLRNLHKLQHLGVLGYHINYIDTARWEKAGFSLPQRLKILDLTYYTFYRLPSCISVECVPNLTHLSLCVTTMDEKGLEFVARLPELYFLSLNMSSTTTMSHISASNGYFQKLRTCEIAVSMIQFQCEEEDSSVSFRIWNGFDAMPFGSGKNDCSVTPSTVMPNLEVLSSRVFVRALKDGNGDCANIGLQCLTSLQQVQVDLDCEGASAAEVEEAEAALRKANEVHPNRPTLSLWRMYTEKMISTVQHPKPGEDDVFAEEEVQQQKVEPMADDNNS